MTTRLVVREEHTSPIRSGAAWLSGAGLVVSALAATAVAFVAVVHLDDRYAIDHASGARIALARYADHGVLYPPLVGEDTFGGTRFMPLPVMLHAALSRLTGEYLVSGKLLAVIAMLAVAVVMFVVLRRNDCPVPLAVGLVSVVATTQTGLLAATGLRADSLPLLLHSSQYLWWPHRTPDGPRWSQPLSLRWQSPRSCTHYGLRQPSSYGFGGPTGDACVISPSPTSE